jgi:hypothetical protein
MYRTQAGLVCHRNPDETVRSVDRSTALRLNTGVHAKHPGQLQYFKIIFCEIGSFSPFSVSFLNQPV